MHWLCHPCYCPTRPLKLEKSLTGSIILENDKNSKRRCEKGDDIRSDGIGNKNDGIRDDINNVSGPERRLVGRIIWIKGSAEDSHSADVL